MACTSFLNTPAFINFAKANGFVSEAGNIQTSAEVAYRFLTNQVDFIESHTGLEDVQIECQILLNCLKTGDENMKMNPYSPRWLNIQRTARQMSLEETFAL